MGDGSETKPRILGTQLFVVCLLLLQSLAPLGLARSQSGSIERLRSDGLSQFSTKPNNVLSPPRIVNPSPSIVRAVLIPSEDSFVDNLSPIANFGSLPVIIVQATPSVPVDRDITFLKFNLADALPAQILSTHAKPTNATLSLYVRLTNFFYNASVAVSSVADNDWTEKTIDWENMPSIVPTDSVTTRITDNGTWARWNVTKIVGLSLSNSSEVSLALMAPSVDWRNYVWFDSKDNRDTNGTTSPRLSLVFVEPYLRLESQFPHLQITIENQTLETDANGDFGALMPCGTYSVAVPQIVPLGEGKRAVFEGWSDGSKDAIRQLTIGNDVTINLNYGTQYHLTVNSPHGITNGTGWYFSGAEAKATVPGTVPVEGLLRFVGVRYVFDHWEGACVSTRPECVLVMDGPRTITAVWVQDYTITLVGFSASVMAVLFLASVKQKSRRGHRRKRR